MMPSNVDASTLLTKSDVDDTKDQPAKSEAKRCCAMRSCHKSEDTSETASCKTSGGCKRGKCGWKAKVAFLCVLPLLPIIVPVCYARYKLCGRSCHSAEIEGKADEPKADALKADADKMDEQKA